jgi:hypothetical protein
LHPNRQKAFLSNANYFRLLRWGLQKHEASGPMKAGKMPRGKLAFPWALFYGFLRMLCIRVGGFQPPGRK